MDDSPRSCPARIVLVEDHDDSRMLVAEALRMTGFLVAECPSGDEALREIDERPCDVLVTDLGLGGMTGAELVRQARNRPGLERLPALAVTGRSALSDGERSAFDAVLTKPLDPIRLSGTILKVLDDRRKSQLSPPSSVAQQRVA